MDKTQLKVKWNLSSCLQVMKERFAFTGLICMGIMTYLYGTFEVLPQILIGFDFHHVLASFLTWFCSTVTTWTMFAIVSNLLLSRQRNSSVVSRMLSFPTVETSSSMENSTNTAADDIIKEPTKSSGRNGKTEHGNWHICSICEVFVPPRAWHCLRCKMCVLRRDHHCVLTMCCVGEENHSNFLGLLLYLAVGTTLATGVNMIYIAMYYDTPLWLFIFKALIPIYNVLYDPTIMTILSVVNFLGMFCSWILFDHHMMLATRNQTSADNDRNIARLTSEQSVDRYSNLEKFLGEKPVLRLLWPFHSPLKIQYGSSEAHETRKVM